MPFGIPREDFHGGFGLYVVDAKTGENRGPVVMDPFDDICVEEVYDEAAEDAHNNLIRGLIEASEDVAEAKCLLVRALDQLYLLGYDSGFTNPAIEQLVTDIKFYLNGGKLNGLS